MASVAVGLSGGVDSSVTALLLKRAGYDVVGVHMRNWDTADELGEAHCPDTDDLRFSQEVCRQLDIPLHQVDLVEAYWNSVFTPFLEAYSEGVTPNPDVWCNREIKFGRFHEYCMSSLGVDFVATGHYCQTVRRVGANSAVQLARGLDPVKDQSYFLCLVPKASLEESLFPVGALHKSQVREIAAEAGLATAQRGDSYGICFIGKRRLEEFLPQYIDVSPAKGACRWFVAGTDVASGVVTVANSSTHPALFVDYIETSAEAFNWIDDGAREELQHGKPLRCKYRIRYRQDEMGSCTVTKAGSDMLRVTFDMAQRAATPGQAVALYSSSRGSQGPGMEAVLANGPALAAAVLPTATAGEVCLGGGIITALGPSYAAQGKDTPPLELRMN